MTTAHASALNIKPTPAAPATTQPAPGDAPAVLITTDGLQVAAGLIEIAAEGTSWTATLTRLDRPGVIASLFYGRGSRDVVIVLDDGRRARARIEATAFIAGGERICQIVGLQPLA